MNNSGGYGYYGRIQECIKNMEISRPNASTVNSFFAGCRKYYYYTLLREGMKDAERRLKDCFDESEYIAQRKIDSNKVPPLRFDLESRLYLELLGEIYDEYYAGDMSYNRFMHDIFSSDESLRKSIRKCFKEEPGALVEKFAGIFNEVADADSDNLMMYAFRRHDFSYIHDAAAEMGRVLDGTQVPPLDVSVEKVIAKEQLEIILDYLEHGSIGGAMFTIAPITRALTDGQYASYTPGRKKVFFNLNSEYNLIELEKRVNDIKAFLRKYCDIMNELNCYREMSV